MSQYPPGQDPFGKDPFGQQSTYQSPYQSPPGGYGYQPPPQGPPLSTLALLSGISGLCSIFAAFFSCCCGVFMLASFAAGLTAVITGHIALAQFNREPGRESGKEWALIGMICGYISVAMAVLWLILFILALIIPAAIPFFAPDQNGPFRFPPVEMPK